jgi:hypothetical protein
MIIMLSAILHPTTDNLLLWTDQITLLSSSLHLPVCKYAIMEKLTKLKGHPMSLFKDI